MAAKSHGKVKPRILVTQGKLHKGFFLPRALKQYKVLLQASLKRKGPYGTIYPTRYGTINGTKSCKTQKH